MLATQCQSCPGLSKAQQHQKLAGQVLLRLLQVANPALISTRLLQL